MNVRQRVTNLVVGESFSDIQHCDSLADRGNTSQVFACSLGRHCSPFPNAKASVSCSLRQGNAFRNRNSPMSHLGPHVAIAAAKFSPIDIQILQPVFFCVTLIPLVAFVGFNVCPSFGQYR